MNTKRVLHVKNFAHLSPLTLEFGDLTIFVGPQATGKSLLLQLFKLVLDQGAIARALERYGFVWSGDFAALNRLYFGEGFEHIWNEDTSVAWEGKRQSIQPYQKLPDRKEKVFYIPAQRALIFQQNSWPRPFDAFRSTDPFVVRYFSEKVRRFLESMQTSLLFPRERRLHSVVRERLEDTVFRGASLEIVTEGSVKRLMLTMPHGDRLPYLGWSAGQREFIPLLLGIYGLLPLGRQTRRQNVHWVIIEEPEMGLHPAAIEDVLLLLVELMHRGYKVILSTHSPAVLDLLWAWKFLKQIPREEAKGYFRRLFALGGEPHVTALAESLWEKSFAVYFFGPDKQGTRVRDISSLEVWAEDETLSSWGHLTTFPGRAGEVVADIVNRLEAERIESTFRGEDV